MEAGRRVHAEFRLSAIKGGHAVFSTPLGFAIARRGLGVRARDCATEPGS